MIELKFADTDAPPATCVGAGILHDYRFVASMRY
jgi:hypothetical protein